ncbi:MAG: hypothetical protein QOE70_1405 [Chthoniobacter sp.]|jgi:hypothetical protein|nr:hypothetical protein [Chthoniobacter sp.]
MIKEQPPLLQRTEGFLARESLTAVQADAFNSALHDGASRAPFCLVRRGQELPRNLLGGTVSGISVLRQTG